LLSFEEDAPAMVDETINALTASPTMERVVTDGPRTAGEGEPA